MYKSYWSTKKVLDVQKSPSVGDRTLFSILYDGELLHDPDGTSDISLVRSDVIQLVQELCAAYDLSVDRVLPEAPVEYIVREH